MELQLTERHIMALNALLVAALIYFAALAVNDVLGAYRATDAAPVHRAHPRVVSDLSANRSRAAYQAIVERDIFNLEAPPPPPPKVVVEDLHLTLIGVSQTTKGRPYAIIANQQGEQSVYQVGEEIPDSGKLLKVEKARAIVEHDGKQVALELPTDEGGSASSPQADATSGGIMTPQAASRQDQGRHRRMRRHRSE